MIKNIYKLVIMLSVALMAMFSSAFSSYAALPPTVSPNASDYIVMYSASADSPSAGKINMIASLRVSGAKAQITTKIYKNGSLYDSFVKTSSNGRATVSETKSVPSGSYYVLYKYQAVIDGVVVESRAIKTSTFTVS